MIEASLQLALDSAPFLLKGAVYIHPTLAEGLRRTDTAAREWIGLAAYGLTGRSSALFPRPD